MTELQVVMNPIGIEYNNKYFITVLIKYLYILISFKHE